MTRSLKALLVAVPNSGWEPDNTVEQAIPSVKRMAGFLEGRFGGGRVEVLADEAAVVTKADLLARLRGLELTRRDLFVLVFYGHGIPASPDHLYQAWALSGREELTDSDLAGFLRESNCKDNVVISACCYGRGLFIPGSRRSDRSELLPAEAEQVKARARLAFRQYAVDLGRTLRERAPGRFVLISAAAVNKLVLEANTSELLDDVQKAAEGNQRYFGLWWDFRRNDFGGRRFFVDVRPRWRLGRRVLAA